MNKLLDWPGKKNTQITKFKNEKGHHYQSYRNKKCNKIL